MKHSKRKGVEPMERSKINMFSEKILATMLVMLMMLAQMPVRGEENTQQTEKVLDALKWERDYRSAKSSRNWLVGGGLTCAGIGGVGYFLLKKGEDSASETHTTISPAHKSLEAVSAGVGVLGLILLFAGVGKNDQIDKMEKEGREKGFHVELEKETIRLTFASLF